MTKIAINRPVMTLMFSLALIFMGIISWRELPVQRLPDITFPAMYYMARMTQGESPPEKTNEELTRPIEKIVSSLAGVNEMHSSTGSGYFWGYARFEMGTDMRFRVIELQDKMSKFTASKGGKIQTEVVPFSTSEGAGDLMELILSVPLGQEFRTSQIGDLIRRKIKSIDGVAQVQVAGERVPNFKLETRNDQLAAYGLSVQNLQDAVNKASVEKAWMGTIREGRKSHDVHIQSRIKNIDELLQVPADKEGIFPLGGLLAPSRETEEKQNVYRFNGKNAIRVSISKEKDRNTIAMARQVRERVEEIRKELPEGFDLSIVSDEAADLEKLIKNVAQLALVGAAISLIVLLLFVRKWRVAMVVVASIPVSILVTFNAMYAAGLSINLLSLLGLAAGVGMLVDNSIVVVENVFRHYQRGLQAKEAAWLGSREVVRAIVVSTATNLVVFVPLLYMDEMAAIVMKEMALSLIFPMLASLFVAMTLVPMLTSRVIAAGRRPQVLADGDDKLADRGVHSGRRGIVPRHSLMARLNPWQQPDAPPRNIFREFVFFCVKGALRHPIRMLIIIIVLLIATLMVSGIKIAIQRYNQPEGAKVFTIYGKPPTGSTLKEADEFFQEKESQIAKEMETSDVFKSFSTQFTKEGGQIQIVITDKYRNLPVYEFWQAYRNLTTQFPNYGFRFRPFPGISSEHISTRIRAQQGGYFQETLQLSGENMEAMRQAADMARDFLKKDKNVGDAAAETLAGNPEVQFIPNLELFRIMKANPSSLQTFFRSREESGIRTSLLLKDNDVERQVTIRSISYDEELKKKEANKTAQRLGELKRFLVPLEGGGMIPLEQLGTFVITQDIQTIEKTNRQRHLNVGFSLQAPFYRVGREKEREELLKGLQKGMSGVKLPMGVTAQITGILEEAEKGRVTFKKLVGMAVLLIFLVIAFFFESVAAPIVILITLPLASIGGIWGIILFNTTLDEIAMLGSIVLAGLAVNNGILLIEYARQMEQTHKFRRSRAILSAVAYRLRPILMTSITTILGLLPILFARDAHKEAKSFVSVLIGGMSFSMLLSLVVVPTFYNVFANAMNRLHVLALRLMGRAPRREQQTTDYERIPSDLSISIRNISKIYPTFKWKKIFHFIPSRTYPYGHRPPSGTNALKHLDMEIGAGMFGLLGPNGAGKTTLMKILTGLIDPTYGIAVSLGNDLRFFKQDIRQYISYLPQNFGVYDNLNLDQYLNFLAPYYGLNDLAERRKRIDEAIEFAGLTDVREKPMKRFSGGMRQRAGIAQFLLSPRPIIIVDEPTAGLDPVERVKFRLLLSDLARTRIVILSTHIVDDITSSCRQVAVLNRGEVLYQGDLQGIQNLAQGLIWDAVLEDGHRELPIPRRQILYRKHIGEDRVLCHYISENPVPGSTPVQPTFEDAYVALLLKHDAIISEKDGK